MPQYKETADDLNRKYQASFMLYDDKLAYCRLFEQDGADIIGQLVYDGSKEKYQLVHIDPTKFKTIDLESHWFNMSDAARDEQKLDISAWRFVKRAYRQNRKGIGHESAFLTTFMKPIFTLVSKQFREPGFTAKIVEDMMQPAYPRYTEALKLCPDKGSLALSPEFAICISHISADKFLLMSKFGFIGQCNENGIIVHHKGALQEVQDYVTRSRTAIEVNYAEF